MLVCSTHTLISHCGWQGAQKWKKLLHKVHAATRPKRGADKKQAGRKRKAPDAAAVAAAKAVLAALDDRAGDADTEGEGCVVCEIAQGTRDGAGMPCCWCVFGEGGGRGGHCLVGHDCHT